MSGPSSDTPTPYVRYIDKTRDYYLSQGFDRPYAWARNESAPWTPLAKPLAASTVALISTAEIAIKDDPAFDDRPETRALGKVYSIASDIPAQRLRSRNLSYDRHATTLDDANAYFPVDQLRAAAARGRIGKLAPRCICVYNAYSQAKTISRDAPEVLAQCRAMAVDAAILVPV